MSWVYRKFLKIESPAQINTPMAIKIIISSIGQVISIIYFFRLKNPITIIIVIGIKNKAIVSNQLYVVSTVSLQSTQPSVLVARQVEVVVLVCWL